MPAYNYHCDKCGEISLERRMTDEEIKICPYCKGELYRVFYPINNIWHTDGGFSKRNIKE